MLIRTQDKRSLVDITRTKIEINQYTRYADTPKEFYQFNVECAATVLGRYSTYNKAIKVLDMIQEAYENANHYGYYYGFIKNTVFEMPADVDEKDEEV